MKHLVTRNDKSLEALKSLLMAGLFRAHSSVFKNSKRVVVDVQA